MLHRFALSMVLLYSSLMTAYGQAKVKFENKFYGKHYCLTLISGSLWADPCHDSTWGDHDNMLWTMDSQLRSLDYDLSLVTLGNL